MASLHVKSSGCKFPSSVDVLVAGGGPGGAALSLEVRRRKALSVLLIEASDYKAFRVGESVPPTIRTLLERIGAGVLLNEQIAMHCHGISSEWARDELEFHDYLSGLSGNGWHLDRRQFDAGLAQVAERAGVEIKTNTRVIDAKRSKGIWRVTLRTIAGTKHVIEAGFLVDATGRSASVARKLGACWQKFDNLVAVIARYRCAAKMPHRVIIEARPSGWWYTAPLPGESIVVAWLSDADLVRAEGMHVSRVWDESLRRTQNVHPLITSAILEMPQRVQSAGSWLLQPAHGNGWLAVGDACACFDPLSSVGVIESLRSGISGGEAVEQWLNGNHAPLTGHTAKRRLEFEDYLLARENVYRTVSRFHNAPFWQRRSGTIHINPQSLVAIPSASTAATKLAAGAKLTRSERFTVAEICRAEPLPAHKVVSELKHIVGWQRSDRRLILGVQEIVEQQPLA